MAIAKATSALTSTLQVIKEWDDSMTDDQKRLLTRDIISKFPARAGKVRVFFDVENRELVRGPKPGFTSGRGYFRIDEYKDNFDLLEIYNDMLSQLVMFVSVKTQDVIDKKVSARKAYYEGFLRRIDMETSPIEAIIIPDRQSHPDDINEFLKSPTKGINEVLTLLIDANRIFYRHNVTLVNGYEILISKLNCEMAEGKTEALEIYNGVAIDWAALDTACVKRMKSQSIHKRITYVNVEMLCEMAYHLGHLQDMKGTLLTLAKNISLHQNLLPNLLVISGMLKVIGVGHYVTWDGNHEMDIEPSYQLRYGTDNLSTFRLSELFEWEMLEKATEFHMVYGKDPQKWATIKIPEWMSELQKHPDVKYSIGIDSQILNDVRTLCTQAKNLKFLRLNILLKMAKIMDIHHFAKVIQPPTEALTAKGGQIVFPQVNA